MKIITESQEYNNELTHEQKITSCSLPAVKERWGGTITGNDFTSCALTSKIVSPIFAGESVTLTPAALKEAIFSSAPPFPPDMIAPA